MDENLGSVSARQDYLTSLSNDKSIGFGIANDQPNTFIKKELYSTYGYLLDSQGFIFTDGYMTINLDSRKNMEYTNMDPAGDQLGFGILHELLHGEGLMTLIGLRCTKDPVKLLKELMFIAKK